MSMANSCSPVWPLDRLPAQAIPSVPAGALPARPAGLSPAVLWQQDPCVACRLHQSPASLPESIHLLLPGPSQPEQGSHGVLALEICHRAGPSFDSVFLKWTLCSYQELYSNCKIDIIHSCLEGFNTPPQKKKKKMYVNIVAWLTLILVWP